MPCELKNDRVFVRWFAFFMCELRFFVKRANGRLMNTQPAVCSVKSV
jgi:hypothetical protein